MSCPTKSIRSLSILRLHTEFCSHTYIPIHIHTHTHTPQHESFKLGLVFTHTHTHIDSLLLEVNISLLSKWEDTILTLHKMLLNF